MATAATSAVAGAIAARSAPTTIPGETRADSAPGTTAKAMLAAIVIGSRLVIVRVARVMVSAVASMIVRVVMGMRVRLLVIVIGSRLETVRVVMGMRVRLLVIVIGSRLVIVRVARVMVSAVALMIVRVVMGMRVRLLVIVIGSRLVTVRVAKVMVSAVASMIVRVAKVMVSAVASMIVRVVKAMVSAVASMIVRVVMGMRVRLLVIVIGSRLVIVRVVMGMRVRLLVIVTGSRLVTVRVARVMVSAVASMIVRVVMGMRVRVLMTVTETVSRLVIVRVVKAMVSAVATVTAQSAAPASSMAPALRDVTSAEDHWEERPARVPNAADLRSANRPDRERSPEIDDDVTGQELDRVTKHQIKTLEGTNADWVSKHLVMAGRLIDIDPEMSFQHALAASRRGGRLAAVREAVGLTAYAAGHYGEALREFRTYRRISGSNVHLPLMADCERGLGRPDRALDVVRSPEAQDLDAPGKVELAIVASGARTDLGQLDAAVAELEIIQLDINRAFSYSPRVFRAYADALTAVGRTEEAGKWHRQAVVAENALGVGEFEDPDIIDLGEDEETDSKPRFRKYEADDNDGNKAEERETDPAPAHAGTSVDSVVSEHDEVEHDEVELDDAEPGYFESDDAESDSDSAEEEDGHAEEEKDSEVGEETKHD
ncbi:tetratricopeptide repeat protein [Arthrobacter sp. NA-172]|uniref:tetratricopeptide repeat protein n=1 Tax=Arthrobacter sp. NA-172 TaxID=3367524 RepID=UPI0037549CA5